MDMLTRAVRWGSACVTCGNTGGLRRPCRDCNGACKRPRPSPRKVRLIACALVRHAWEHLGNDHARRAVEVAERFAEGQASEAEMARAYRATASALATPPCQPY